ncbi:MAG: hypothetical protein KatS3mg060_2389 [Dehalococcoidia bacterium]|nr:MAG: hypothetical protein KatS3mg060_2389 [Dehalococcoidia bacterium]
MVARQAEQAALRIDEALRQVEEMAKALPVEALRYAPAENEWPIDWIVRHIGIGARFRLDLERARESGQFPPTKFGDYTAVMHACSGRPIDAILAETAADFRAYRDLVRSLSDESLSERYTVTMPSGRQLDLSTADNVQAVVAHTQEHLAQISDWLARRAG